jgi:TrmH family RNA methyltransferase
MSLKSIASRDNPEFKRLLGLAEDSRARRAGGHTLIDGEHLLEEALRAGIDIACLIVARDAAAGAAWMARLPGARVVQLAPALFKALSPVAAPTGVLAEIAIPAAKSAPARVSLLLEAIQDPGNLGAILRSAAAAGVEQVLLSDGCADVWAPKVLRGGQGGHFRLDLRAGVDLGAWLDAWPGTAHAALPRATTSLYDLDLRGPVAFVFGNEGSGLSAEVAMRCRGFAIPMAAGVESLNVAAAVAVCLYERYRQVLR